MSETNTTRLPRHVAIIMDGNGRWAKAHKLAVAQGHRQGTEALRAIIRESSDIGIEALTIYAFSTENWRRSRAEVSTLMSLLLEYFTSEIDELDEKNVCIRILGDKDGLPAPQRDALIAAETRTARNTGLKLNIAINYGGRAEIVRAARMLAQKAVSGEITPEDIDENAFAAAYFVGSRFGKRKLIPAVSPNKTVAGAVAGLIGSMLTALIIYGLTLAFMPSADVSLMPPIWHFVIIGFVGGIAGELGDLFASLVKRHCGIKDYGNIFPGHGGMMDRLDSVLFVSVLIYLYQSLMW